MLARQAMFAWRVFFILGLVMYPMVKAHACPHELAYLCLTHL